jgi:hypothetical protein
VLSCCALTAVFSTAYHALLTKVSVLSINCPAKFNLLRIFPPRSRSSQR